MLPLITVAMPIYNAGAYLRPAVLSIVNQTYTSWHLLIIDDGSTDNALETIADIKDKRITVLKDEVNKGLAARLNEAIDLAKGEYFARMDQDDISYPERLEKQVSELQDHPELDLICVRAITISEVDEAIGYLPYQLTHAGITARPWRGFHMPHPTWAGRTVWFRKHRYSSDNLYFCEDQELLLRTYRYSKFACIPQVLFAYRLRKKNSLAKLQKIRQAMLLIQLKSFLEARNFQYAFLAITNYVFNVFKDNWRAIMKLPYSPYITRQVENEDAEQYQKVLQLIKKIGE